MKSDKSGNSDLLRNKPETRGRKKNINPSIQVSWRIPYDVYQLLEKEQKRIEKDMGVKLPLSEVFQGIVNKSLK